MPTTLKQAALVKKIPILPQCASSCVETTQLRSPTTRLKGAIHQESEYVPAQRQPANHLELRSPNRAWDQIGRAGRIWFRSPTKKYAW